MIWTTIANFSIRSFPCRRVCFSTAITAATGNSTIKKRNSEWLKHQLKNVPRYKMKELALHNQEENENVEKFLFKIKRLKIRKRQKSEFLSNIIYLRKLGFSLDVILETPEICLYQRSRIQEALQEIHENELELKKAGLVSGFAKGRTENFQNGTYLPDKRLQLCLYYMEIPFNFKYCKF